MNLPNKLTLMRILLVPFIIVLPIFALIDPANNFLNKYIAYDVFKTFCWMDLIILVIFIVASFTDYLDGHIARSRGLVTDFGKFLDPLADKLLVCSTLIYLLERGRLWGFVVTIIIAREFAVTGLRLIASNKNIVIAASYYGKAKTVSQMIMTIVLLLANFPFALISENLRIDHLLICVATVLTVVSGIDYFVKNKEVIQTK